MASETFTVNGPYEEVQAELRKALAIPDGEPLETVVRADGFRVPVSFELRPSDRKQAAVHGLTVTTRRVQVSATSPTSLGFRQSVPAVTDREVAERIQTIAQHLQNLWPEAATPETPYEFSYRDTGKCFEMVYQDDVDADCAPCEIADAGQSGWCEIRKNGSAVGRLRRYNNHVQGQFDNVAPDEARIIAAAIRSWARGLALIDRPAFSEKVL